MQYHMNLKMSPKAISETGFSARVKVCCDRKWFSFVAGDRVYCRHDMETGVHFVVFRGKDQNGDCFKPLSLFI